ncbi:MAG TPA: glycosyltransferase [Holophagaceae bacterium]|nr:glycosyltransferase [Holophagaceae bacterium]
MSFRPCLVVPVYDPGPALARTLDALLATGHTLFIHDDGSGEAARLELARYAGHPRIRLSRWEANQGKGAAVCEALRRAFEAGFTHALQVDADGQHDSGAVAAFMALGEAHPEAVIAGVPAYEGPVPPARRYGRLLTHAWVHLETLSFAIGDSLCGFRLYPLRAAVRLMGRVELPKRMDFDTAIIVRLAWMGLPILNAPVKVVYPEDGVSHFHFLRDNLRLTRMHTRLVCGMLLRLPLLLGRKLRPRREADPHWARIQERGTALGLRTMLWTYRLLGARGLRFVTEFVVAYFFLTGAEARRASGNYLARLHAMAGPLPGLPRRPRLRDRYRHIRAFAQSYVDRFLAWMDAADVALVFPERAAFEAQLASGRGALFISAHLGNLDMLRGLGASEGMKGLNAVVYSEHVVRFQSLLKGINPHYEANLIHVRDAGPGTAMALEDKIAKGESLFIVGDRPPAEEGGRTLRIPFLGHEAPFPIGPMVLAHLLQCPVHLFFCVKEGGAYRIHLEPFADRITLPRKDRDAALRSLLERYAAAVEAQCRRTPLQWFNFYDFWGDTAAPEPSRPAHES